jgi:plasmid stabilization system protein ParE
MRIRYTSDALNDIADILNFIVDENPSGAQNVANAIERALALVSFMPKLGRPVPGRPGRLHTIARPYPYRVTFRVFASEIEVLEIVHMARSSKV